MTFLIAIALKNCINDVLLAGWFAAMALFESITWAIVIYHWGCR